MQIDWSLIRLMRPADFSAPELLDHSVVAALDRFAQDVKARPVILDDWRPVDPRWSWRHPTGKAVDVAFPGLDAGAVFERARRSGLFDGIGIYRNERGAVSFHLDTTGVRGTWGGVISATAPDAGRRVRYTTAEEVLGLLKRAWPVGLLLLVALGLLFLKK